ncbi:MAG: dihydrolipoyl dehydrogenase [Candidatus Cloacimonetes bacterium]|nr:dihydrolipoyl dehydrogenase [Candidatus Cloacimonadota bacterium]
MENKIKIAIIGGGPGGYETAIRLNQYGIPATVFEKERLGGVCLNWGCIPTKALVKTSELLRELSEADTYGIAEYSRTQDYNKIFERKNAVVEQLVSGIEFIFRKRKIPVVNEAVVSLSRSSEGYLLTTSSKETYEAEYVVLATGSGSKELPGIKIDEKYILSSTGLLKLSQLPKRLAVIGGGVIGCEFASIFSTLSVEVHIVEFLPRLISTEDEEISKRFALALKKAGIAIHLNTAVEAAERLDNELCLKLSNGSDLIVDQALMSVGRTPNLNIDFSGLDLATERGFVLVNDNMQTNLPKIYAIGDLTGKMLLAHTASKQGLHVAEHVKHAIEGGEHALEPINYTNIPRCTFTFPEIASIGLTEAQAKEQYGEILIGKFPFAANGKAIAMSSTFGFVKTIARSDNHQLIGMHIIGAQAAELIAQGSILIALGAKAEDVEHIVFAHPTLSEAIMESLEDLRDLSIHKT